MPTYIGLVNWTAQGIANFKETIDRVEAANQFAEKVGATLANIYWTLGEYDIVAMIEAPDDESATAFLLALGSQGNVRTKTLRAFDRDEMQGIIQKVG